jgi:hypothetical protein
MRPTFQPTPIPSPTPTLYEAPKKRASSSGGSSFGTASVIGVGVGVVLVISGALYLYYTHMVKSTLVVEQSHPTFAEDAFDQRGSGRTSAIPANAQSVEMKNASFQSFAGDGVMPVPVAYAIPADEQYTSASL